MGCKRDRLHGRMHGEFFRASGMHRANAGVLPDIGTVASQSAELDVVDLRTAASLPNKNKFMPVPIERTPAGISFDRTQMFFRSVYTPLPAAISSTMCRQ
jgi:hypothetical protein